MDLAATEIHDFQYTIYAYFLDEKIEIQMWTSQWTQITEISFSDKNMRSSAKSNW